jgi:transposase
MACEGEKEVTLHFSSVRAMDITRRDVKVLVETCRRNEMTPKATHEFICNAWGVDTISLSHVYHLHSEFVAGRESFDDAARPGRPCAISSNENVEEVRHLLEDDNCLSIRDVQALTGIAHSTVSRIIHDNLCLKSIALHWVPHILSDKNKEDRVQEAKNILKFLWSSAFIKQEKILVIIDEKWIYHRSVGNRRENKAWIPCEAGPSSVPRRAKRLQTEKKSMLIVAVTSDGRFSFEIMSVGETINGPRYKEFLLQMHHNFSRQVNSLDWMRMVIMHDNATSHTCKLVTAFLESHGVQLLKQPPWSPDFNILDRYVFAAVENARVQKDFVDVNDIHRFLTDCLHTVCSHSFSTQFPLLKMDLEDVINSSGDYLSD